MYQYPFPNPYQAMTPNMPNAMPTTQVIKVNGRNGAQAYQMPANSSALLLDETAPIVWLKTTDGASYPTLTAYDIKLHEDLPPVDMHDLEARIKRIEEVINNAKPDIAENERKNDEPYESSTEYGRTNQDRAEPTGIATKFVGKQSSGRRGY